MGSDYSEDEMLNIIRRSVSSIELNFSRFRAEFSADASSVITVDSRLMSSLQDIRGKRDVVRFISKEPVFFRPEPFRRALLDEFLVLELQVFVNIVFLLFLYQRREIISFL